VKSTKGDAISHPKVETNWRQPPFLISSKYQ